MDAHSRPSAIDTDQHTPRSAVSSVAVSSPVPSVFSKGHSSKSSGSSIASSPLPHDGFDLYGSKVLESLTEDPHERDDEDTLVNDDNQYSFELYDRSSVDEFLENGFSTLPVEPDYSLGDVDSWSTYSSIANIPKRQRSVESPRTSVSRRLSDRFGSLSRRWKQRSGVGPQLSIVTNADLFKHPGSRSSSTASSHIASPVYSAFSKHDSVLPASPLRSKIVEPFPDPVIDSTYVETNMAHQDGDNGEQMLATTPLLPPTLTEQTTKKSTIQSPLQSPSIAPIRMIASPAITELSPLTSTPTPPLSHKPSVASLHARARSNTATLSPIADIPPMTLTDPLAQKLGHWDFIIHPEPYMPEVIDIESFREYRANWEHARCNFAKQLARVSEHTGPTSNFTKWTKEKWALANDTWKQFDTKMSSELGPELARLSDQYTDVGGSMTSSAVLERPPSRVELPALSDRSGKFPELGDNDIVGPMSVVRARAPTLQKQPVSPPLSPRKLDLRKILSDIFGKPSTGRQ